MNHTDLAPPLPQSTHRQGRRWRRWLIGAGLLFALITLYILLLFYISGVSLRLAEAEADRLDPGWRFFELEASRQEIVESENGASRMLATDKLLPSPLMLLPEKPPQENEALQKTLDALPPPEPLRPAETAALPSWPCEAVA
jgi:hypothetical protein